MKNYRENLDKMRLSNKVRIRNISRNHDSLKVPTRISLCSRNCRMTFLIYSRLTSSSTFVDVAVLGAGEGDLAGVSAGEGDEIEVCESVAEPLEASTEPAGVRVDQYPTPGLRWRSRSAAEDWTLRSSSRSVLFPCLSCASRTLCSSTCF